MAIFYKLCRLTETQMQGGGCLPRRPRVHLLPVLVPGVNPTAVAGGEGLAGDAGDFTYGGGAEGLITLAFAVVEVNPTAVLGDKKR